MKPLLHHLCITYMGTWETPGGPDVTQQPTLGVLACFAVVVQV